MQSFTKKARVRLGSCAGSWRISSIATPRLLTSRWYATQLDLPALDMKWRAAWKERERAAIQSQPEAIEDRVEFDDRFDLIQYLKRMQSQPEAHKDRIKSNDVFNLNESFKRLPAVWEKKESAAFRKVPVANEGLTETNEIQESKPKESVEYLKKNIYILPMFPYPSGKLHLGHLRVYTIADVVARYRRLQGRDVLLPMGWDAFGLPAENAAIERGIDPATWTRENIQRMKEQLALMNGSFDWSREFATCDPSFYKQTQKIFLYLYQNGLVSQRLAQVNWDPVDKTVLANEQVDADGRSWRSGAKIELRNLKQWFFHITNFQDVLLRDLEKLRKNDAWPERVLAQQKNWLGRTFGAYYRFRIKPSDGVGELSVKVYTTRPETIFGVQFIALSPKLPIVEKIAKNDANLRSFLERAENLIHKSTEGYLLPNLTATPDSISPDGIRNMKRPIPVYVAAYVRGDYETGAIMGVPAHDTRDFEFWKQHCPDEPLRYAVTPAEDGSTEDLGGQPFLDSGFMTKEAGGFAKASSEKSAEHIIPWMQKKAFGVHSIIKWKLRDWLISRQRYWGTPIPIIHCSKCGAQPVPFEDLPVVLPKVDHHWADGKSGNPLDSATEWINAECPKCHLPAKRDTDTMDTFVDSSWYYARFADPHNEDRPISVTAMGKHLPVDLYIGGVEHAILHLLYARFIYKAITGILYHKNAVGKGNDLFESTAEPFKRLITQGMVHGKTYSEPSTGRFLKPEEVDLSNPSQPKVVATGQPASVSFEKMSKSKHNGVDPTTFISKYGADATRAHMLFQAPVSDVVNWDEHKITGITRWLNRLYGFVQKLPSAPAGAKWQNSWNVSAYFADLPLYINPGKLGPREADLTVWRATHAATESVTDSYNKVYSLNTAVSSLMSLTNTLNDNPTASEIIKVQATSRLLKMLSPIAPAFAEECWSHLWPSSPSIFELEDGSSGWPVPGNSLDHLVQRHIKCAVQVNGKLKCVVDVLPEPQDAGTDTIMFQNWMTEQLLNNEEASEKLTKGGIDIRNARKFIAVKGGKTVNYVI